MAMTGFALIHVALQFKKNELVKISWVALWLKFSLWSIPTAFSVLMFSARRQVPPQADRQTNTVQIQDVVSGGRCFILAIPVWIPKPANM